MQVLNLTRLPRASKISYFSDRLLGDNFDLPSTIQSIWKRAIMSELTTSSRTLLSETLAAQQQSKQDAHLAEIAMKYGWIIVGKTLYSRGAAPHGQGLFMTHSRTPDARSGGRPHLQEQPPEICLLAHFQEAIE
jgi:hypothetical protein